MFERVKQHRVLLWKDLTHENMRRDRLDVYIHKYKCVDKFFRSFHKKSEDKPVIAYGGC